MAQGKELEELVVGVMELALLLADKFKDGVQPADALDIFAVLKSDPKFSDAVMGLSNIPAEVRDYSVKDGIDLGVKVLEYVPKFIDLFTAKS